MRDITKEFFESSLEWVKGLSDEELVYDLGKRKIYLPRKLVLEFVERRRYYEFEDVSDIKRNFAAFSRKSFAPFSYVTFMYKVLLPTKIKFRWNFNEGSIENVYLEDFVFSENKNCKICEFDIRDKNSEIIRGVFHYNNHLPENFLGISSEEVRQNLERLFSSSARDTFDLDFCSLGPKKNKLLVYSIEKFDDDGESLEVPSLSLGSFMPQFV